MKALHQLTYLLLCLSLLGCSKQTGAEQDTFRDKLKLVTISGEPVDENRFKNKVLIVNLWATWCGPCIREMPDLEDMNKQLPDDIILVLASDEEVDRVQRFLQSRSYDLEFLRVTTSIESLGAYSLPTTLVINQEGELIDKLVGARKWNTPDQIQLFKNYLK